MTQRILIADDRKSARESIADLIQSAGEDWVCLDAEGGHAAVQQALEAKPDLAILDISMPDLDGITAGREILRRNPRLPVLIYSLYAGPELDVAARREGFQGAVAKTDGIGLVTAIRKILSSKASC